MQVHIAGKRFDVSSRLKSHIESGAAKLMKFYDPIIDCRVTVGQENLTRRADIVVQVDAQMLKASNEAESVYVAVDGAMEKMERQLKKLRGKRRNHRSTAAASAAAASAAAAS